MKTIETQSELINFITTSDENENIILVLVEELDAKQASNFSEIKTTIQKIKKCFVNQESLVTLIFFSVEKLTPQYSDAITDNFTIMGFEGIKSFNTPNFLLTK